MSRIKIEDLPVVENMTPEEKVEIFGAGRTSFRPMLESLENREMMDAAGLGHGLQIPLGQSTGGNQLALIRQLASEPVQQVNHVVGSVMQTAQQINQFVHSALESGQAAHAAMRQAVIDQLFSGLGRQNLLQSLPQALPQGQQAPSVQGDSEYVTQRAEQFLKDEIIGPLKKWSNRWGLDYVIDSRTTVDGDKLKVTFRVWYNFARDSTSCNVNFIFEGKNTGGVKRYELVGAGLEDWDGWDFVGKQFEDVAKELFRNKVGSIECGRFDEKTFVNNVLRQAEKTYGVKEGTFEKNIVERIDGGIRILMYTDNKPFNPDSGAGRGELWLTFKYNDADVAKGFVKVDGITQGYWSSGKWTATEIDKDVLNHMRAAEWKVGA